MDWRYPMVPCERCGSPVHCANVIYALMPPLAEEAPGAGDSPRWVCPECFLANVRSQRGGTRGCPAA